MPLKSSKQYRLARAASNSSKGIGGLSQEAAKEMLAKTPKKKRSMFSKRKDD